MGLCFIWVFQKIDISGFVRANEAVFKVFYIGLRFSPFAFLNIF